MSGDTSREIERALFETASGIEDAGVRREFLASACGGNAERLKRIESWLDIQASAEMFFRNAAIARTDVGSEITQDLENMTPQVRLPDPDADEPGSRIGRYRLLKRIGEGGSGVVYLAEQLEPVLRRVALKIIRSGLDSVDVISRFEAERQSLALMDHQGIARVFDAGETDSGRPYFVMELVSGEKITVHCDTQRLGLRPRLELFIQVCHAIQHAHQKGVIHRDVKPSNVLVTLQDGVAVPKVIDFGIARAIEGALADQTAVTALGQFAGTPAYMSPEQAEGGQFTDTRSDVYSLGVLLYELLTGRTPFDGKRMMQAGLLEMLRILREEEPPWPSVALTRLKPEELAAVAAARSMSPATLVAGVKGDLDGIVAKAMAKDRQRRYDTVNGLAMDLARFLNDEPVIARTPGRRYLLSKLLRRHKLVFLAAAAVMLALVAGLATASWFYLREREARQTQARLRDIAELARANETRLLHEAKVRESISQAAMLLAEGKMEEADALLLKTPPESIDPSMEAANVLVRLAEWNAIRQRWQQAADCYLLFLQANQRGHALELESGLWIPLSIGPALVEAGRHADYERFRHMMIERYSQATDPMQRANLLRTCLLLPADEPLLAHLRPHIDPIRAVIAAKEMRVGQAGWGAYSLALMAWRSGDSDEALERSRESIASRISNTPRVAGCQALAAMAAYRLGQTDAARGHLEQARAMQARFYNRDAYYPPGTPGGHWVDWAIARILEREAAALIGDHGIQPR